MIYMHLKNTTTDAAQCRFAFVVEKQTCMISMHLKNTTTDAAQCRYAFVVEIQACMFSTQVEKTPRPMRPNVAILSLWKHNHA
jgi:hypothetical protein